MGKIIEWFSKESNRAYLYRVLIVTGPLLQVYGLMQSSTWALWLGLFQTILGLSTAISNTSTKSK